MGRQRHVIAGLLLGVGLVAPAAGPAAPPAPAADVRAVACEGDYPLHLQGVCTGDDGAIFWCFTTTLVKTDPAGKAPKRVEVARHHGDLCFARGKVYVAVNLGRSAAPKGEAGS